MHLSGNDKTLRTRPRAQWTPEQKEEALRLLKHMSAAKVGRALKTTRSAILGMSFRKRHGSKKRPKACASQQPQQSHYTP